MREQEIYFHVGLGKVASTWLQQKIFPALEGVRYISTHQYKRSKKIIPRLVDDKILISREFDRQFEQEVRWFTHDYPQARIIIFLRRHDDWITSQYKRHVKNGFFYTFEKFLDLENDAGFWPQREMLYYPKLKIVDECCDHEPLILLYEDLVKEPETCIRQLTDYMGIAPLAEISREKVHTSFSEKQLKVLRAFCRRFVHVVPRNYHNKILHWLLYRPVWAFYHLILYAAKYFPESWVPSEPLIEPEKLVKVREMFAEDWERCRGS